MNEIKCDVAVVGGGPAGLAAAVAARETGAEHVLIVERDGALGGILQQCIHPGFGLTRFHEELTGPEYYGRFTARAQELGVQTLLNAMVLQLDHEKRELLCTGSACGLTRIRAGSIVLAMGCREKTRAGIMVPGTRPAGLYTAGAAQRMMNRQNMMVGHRVVILGSGDIGMIMARRMTLEGAQVVMVVELMDYLAGLTRNRVQCLEDFGIPLRLSHTITRIEGERRVTGVWVAPVDENKKPLLAREEFVPCDTVLFSVGLMPENELTRAAGITIDPVTNGPVVNQMMQTSAPGVFACGNVVHVNDLVDNVSAESALAGRAAAEYALGMLPAGVRSVSCVPGRNVRYICPQKLCIAHSAQRVSLSFRALWPENNITITAQCGGQKIAKRREVRINPGEIACIDVDTAAIVGDTVCVAVEKEA